MEDYATLKKQEKSAKDQLAGLQAIIKKETILLQKALANTTEAKERVQLYVGIIKKMVNEPITSLVEYRDAKERMRKNKRLAIEAKNETAVKNLLIARMSRDEKLLRGLIASLEARLEVYDNVVEFSRW